MMHNRVRLRLGVYKRMEWNDHKEWKKIEWNEMYLSKGNE